MKVVLRAVLMDNETMREQDERRILWAAGDIVEIARLCHAGVRTTRKLSKPFMKSRS
jgi:hypothetical protein